MPNKPRVSNGVLWMIAIAMLAALAWGLEQVAFLPIQTGDVYPPFSSLRADPLGAKGLYESLAALPGITVVRLYKNRQRLESSRDTMFVLGVDPISWAGVDSKTLEGYEKLVRDGGRLVIGFLPVRTPAELPKKRPVEELWDVSLRYDPRQNDYSSGGVPHETALFFEAGPVWHDEDGFIERSFGKGSVVLANDTFVLSNEGLRDARDPEFIVKLAGPATRITFDENHFGVSETGSVTALMRRYRLQGAMMILIIVAALFLWRSASSLLPPRESGDALASAKGAIAGRDSLEGLAALLHRGVPEKQLLDTCFAEWSKSSPRERRSDAIRAEIARHASSPVDAYRAASRILTEKNK